MSAANPPTYAQGRWLLDTLAKPQVPLAEKRNVLASWGFGYRLGEIGQFQCDLPSLYPHSEIWQSSGQLKCGQFGAAAFAGDDEFMLAEMLLHEEEGGGLIRTSSDAYRRMMDYTLASGYPNLLRTWTYFSAINAGDGEAERYKQFCLGRARASSANELLRQSDPAASVIGRVGSASPWLHMIWLAGKNPGKPIDNPRQQPPRMYSAEYGQEPPRFSRGMLINSTRGHAILISGTASIVGEASQHPRDLPAQFAESARNLDVVLAQAAYQIGAQASFGARTVLRAYVREEERQFEVAALMQQRFPNASYCVIAGEVCRSELLVELEAVHHF
jgi:chorismate lyase/3-hydroxybenzoate synthase